MNQLDLRRNIIAVVAIYALWVLVGIAAFVADNRLGLDEQIVATAHGHIHAYQVFELYKEITPVVVLLPAAWVGFCFQRRIAFVADLRLFWPALVDAVQRTVEYTRREAGDRLEYERTLTALRSRIDDARALFRRQQPIEEGAGKYPYEGITRIHDLFRDFGYSDTINRDGSTAIRVEIVKHWQIVRGQLLKEFDRADVD
jgi:hypothetical protein